MLLCKNNVIVFGIPRRIQTLIASVRSAAVIQLTYGDINLAPQDGLEPPTSALTVRGSTTELLGNKYILAPRVGIEPTSTRDPLVNSQEQLPLCHLGPKYTSRSLPCQAWI